ncbi:LysR family transcriptional regulator [Leptolyngbya ohadii]|uniref:LysR family transcriptional regulator n=1 Tax=Leptolyngbya ohadii TaxID=1962290 RepID=UPI000B59F271|nr:LysR family transcriptional regulator [Leptolyngbya ohadii]
MNLEAVKLSQLRALAAIARYGNFSEAALQLGVSQSAVSHAIAALEAELGVVLLSRGRYGASLTPVGERILAHAHAMLDSLEAIGKEANLAKGLQGGNLRIASFRSAATHVLPGVIAEFQKRFPGISITIRECRFGVSVAQALRQGQADLGITILPTSSEFETWELLRDEYLVLFPPNCTVKESLSWQDLYQFPLILPASEDECRLLIDAHFDRFQQPLKPTYEVMEDSTAVGMVSQGLGITIMGRLAAEPLPANVQVRSLPVKLERIIGAAIVAEALHSPAVYAFLDSLKASGSGSDAAIPLKTSSLSGAA